MGILELHFHDSELSWNFGPGADEERSFSLGTGGESKTTATNGGREKSESPSLAPKLRSFGVLALVIGAGILYNRRKARRKSGRAEEAETEEKSAGRRFSLSRSK
ncbi:hypothetical protein [Halorussus halophilus]|uniref:hypothetical protein n=1 Tax=Halorussus halophilus TaxID=2650975 RepID=UPI00130155E7|nr:hypothetical protein [Halorussus halophilus]